jgi:hypothetical protein
MKRTGILWMALVLAISGCASYRPTAAPVPQPGAMPHRQEVANAAVSADPYTKPERVKATFGGDLIASGVLPIQVNVENLGPQRLLVRPSDAVLELSDGRQIAPAGAFASASKMERSGRVVAATVGFGLLGYLAASGAEDKARAARQEDFRRKEFPEKRLEKGESAHGFLYFLTPPGTTNLSSATLAMRLVEVEGGKSSMVKVPLSGSTMPASSQ